MDGYECGTVGGALVFCAVIILLFGFSEIGFTSRAVFACGRWFFYFPGGLCLREVFV
jgi:hypothetical protein